MTIEKRQESEELELEFNDERPEENGEDEIDEALMTDPFERLTLFQDKTPLVTLFRDFAMMK